MQFWKAEGLGNNFILMFKKELPTNVTPTDLAKKLCKVKLSIGADGLVVLDNLSNPCHVTFYNQDGSKAEQCGNALRVVTLLLDQLHTQKQVSYELTTANGSFNAQIVKRSPYAATVKVAMGKPSITHLNHGIQLHNKQYFITEVSMGNPHIILECHTPQEVPVNQLGPQLEHHPLFPNKTNVHFVNFENKKQAIMRTWERGVGETSACGSGACAVLVAGVLLKKLNPQAQISLPGGNLDITWSQTAKQVFMTGPASLIFKGKYYI
ncbi:MAG: hypothetical protein RLZ12_899 [Bacillota bacterium]